MSEKYYREMYELSLLRLEIALEYFDKDFNDSSKLALSNAADFVNDCTKQWISSWSKNG